MQKHFEFDSKNITKKDFKIHVGGKDFLNSSFIKNHRPLFPKFLHINQISTLPQTP